MSFSLLVCGTGLLPVDSVTRRPGSPSVVWRIVPRRSERVNKALLTIDLQLVPYRQRLSETTSVVPRPGFSVSAISVRCWSYWGPRCSRAWPRSASSLATRARQSCRSDPRGGHATTQYRPPPPPERRTPLGLVSWPPSGPNPTDSPPRFRRRRNPAGRGCNCRPSSRPRPHYCSRTQHLTWPVPGSSG